MTSSVSVCKCLKKGVQDLPEPRASLVFLPPKTREIVLFFVKSSLTGESEAANVHSLAFLTK
jgi:hypothetical protein